MLSNHERVSIGLRYGHSVVVSEKKVIRYESECREGTTVPSFEAALDYLRKTPFGESQRVHKPKESIDHEKIANDIFNPIGIRAVQINHNRGVPSPINFALYKNRPDDLPTPICLLNLCTRENIGDMEATLENVEKGPGTVWSSKHSEFDQAFYVSKKFNVGVILGRFFKCKSFRGYRVYPGFCDDMEWDYDTRKRDRLSRLGVVTDPEKIIYLPAADLVSRDVCIEDVKGFLAYALLWDR